MSSVRNDDRPGTEFHELETTAGKLAYRKLCATWVTEQVANEHVANRVDCAQEFLDRYREISKFQGFL